MLTWAVQVTYTYPHSKEKFIDKFTVLAEVDKHWEDVVEIMKTYFFKAHSKCKIDSVRELNIKDLRESTHLMVDHNEIHVLLTDSSYQAARNLFNRLNLKYCISAVMH